MVTGILTYMKSTNNGTREVHEKNAYHVLNLTFLLSLY